MPDSIGFNSIGGTVTEGTGTNTLIQIGITRYGNNTGAPGGVGAASANWSVSPDNIGVSGDDFVGGVLPSGTVTWADGETGTKVISFYINGDSRPEDNEGFRLGLTNLVNVTVPFETNRPRYAITNDDFETQTVAFTGDVTSTEGDDGTTLYNFTVTRSGGTTGNLPFQIAFDAGTTDASDFVNGLPVSQNYSITEGQTSRTVTISVKGDQTVENNEQFSLSLASTFSVTPGVTARLGQQSTATGFILNDDAFGGGLFSIVSAASGVVEGNSGTTPVVFTITRSGAGGGIATVNYALAFPSLSAASLNDFAGATSGAVTFVGNETKTITILVAGDYAIEGNEGFSVVLSSPTDGAGIATGSAASVIVNDDAPGALSVANASTIEGDTGVAAGAFVVTRSVGATGTVTVNYTISAPGGTRIANPADLDGPLTGTLTFLEGETAKLIPFDVVGDDLIEGEESFTVTLGNATGGAIISNATAIATIIDDEEVVGTSVADVLTGTTGNDYLDGRGGDDVLRGLAGNDVLNGGAGVDRAEGGIGNDIYLVDSAVDQAVEAIGEGDDVVYTFVSYALAAGSEIEELSAQIGSATTRLDLTGNAFANRLYGNAGINVLNGGGGADIMAGFGGDDTYLVDDARDHVFEAVGQGYDVIFTLTSFALSAGSEVEELSANNSGGTDRLDLTGNEFANRLYGNAGVNVLNGGGGPDIMVGFGGNDTYLVDTIGDQVLEAVGQGYDTVFTLTSFVLDAGSEVEELSANNSSGTDRLDLTGNEYANGLYGNAGVNVLNGGGGADIMVGFGGNDYYLVDTQADQVIEGTGGGYDTVYAAVSYTLAAGIEVEELSANNPSSTARLDLGGNERANAIYGSAGINVLYGGDGSDTLTGGGGADIFVFDTTLANGGIDRITDFTVGIDKIALDDAMFAGLTSVTASSFTISSRGALDGDGRIVYDSATGALLFDPDGNGVMAAIQFATVNAGLALTAADFMVI